ncbi:hypothetical protein TIFTF001_042592 [Ficus carica]|uniref:Uncharacterized protein n=1 Tax=Ficus carica TaxID=3494 RepID=A0AA88A4J7_FICCA|nr:hypothetical protein TIFTF001_042592 [Ficus carica]
MDMRLWRCSPDNGAAAPVALPWQRCSTAGKPCGAVAAAQAALQHPWLCPGSTAGKPCGAVAAAQAALQRQF